MEYNKNYSELNYGSFKPYDQHRIMDGYKYEYRFENGYGASVIKHSYSYGHEDDLWELAVLKKRYENLSPELEFLNKWDLCYDTPLTDDVIGYLNDKEVIEILLTIKNLKVES